MTTRFIFTALIILSIQNIFAQSPTFGWAKQFGGTHTEYGQSITVGLSGNIYTTGQFFETTDFDSDTGIVNLTSSGYADAFIHKSDANGNFVWVKQIGGSGTDYGKSIVVDSSENVYTCGLFSGTVDFDPGTDTFNLTSVGTNNAFVQKLDSDGNLIWAIQVGGSDTKGESITIDESGNIYVTGIFIGTCDFDPGSATYNLTSQGSWDTYIQKLDSNGNFVWAKQYGGTNDNRGLSIGVDTLGNVYSTGHFRGTVDFDPGTSSHNITAVGQIDAYIAKLDTNGDFVWAKSLGGNLSTCAGYSMDISASGDIYIVGGVLGNVDFDPGTDTNYINTNSGSYVEKLDNNGNFVWVKHVSSSSAMLFKSILLDNSDNIYIAGEFMGTADFDPGTGVSQLNSLGTFNSFTYKLDVDGNFIWVKQIESSFFNTHYSIALDNFNNIYTTGGFSQTADFDPDTGVFNLDAYDVLDAFIQKIYQCNPVTPIPELDTLPTLTGECLVHLPAAPIATNQCGFLTGTTSTSFPITTVGETIITWTYDDGNGNVSTQNQSIVVIDTIHPEIDSLVLPTISSICEITTSDVSIPTATDNCSGVIMGVSNVSFPLTDHSVSQIMWSFDDGNGNIITQNQMINWMVIDNTTNFNGSTITANNTNATYQWLDCDNNYDLISGETNQSYTPQANGNYAVQITENECIDTSVCISISTMYVNEFDQELKLSVYPNPSSDVFNITFGENLNQVELILTDVLGKTLLLSKFYGISKTNIDLRDKDSGVYWLVVKANGSEKIIKLIKE